MGFLKFLIDNNIPFEINNVSFTIDKLGIKDKYDMDVLLSMVNPEHKDCINNLLDIRNLLP